MDRRHFVYDIYAYLLGVYNEHCYINTYIQHMGVRNLVDLCSEVYRR